MPNSEIPNGFLMVTYVFSATMLGNEQNSSGSERVFERELLMWQKLVQPRVF